MSFSNSVIFLKSSSSYVPTKMSPTKMSLFRVIWFPKISKWAESRITYPFLSPFIGNRNRYREMFIVHNKQELENNTNIFLPNDRGLNSAQGVQILCHSLYQGSDEWHNLLTFKERFNSAFQIKSARKSVTLLLRNGAGWRGDGSFHEDKDFWVIGDLGWLSKEFHCVWPKA